LPPWFALASFGTGFTLSPEREATVRRAVGHITGRSFPAILTYTLHRLTGIPHTTLPTARAVIGACVHPGSERQKNQCNGKCHIGVDVALFGQPSQLPAEGLLQVAQTHVIDQDS